nr:MAG TPA: hypothetical protein [Caudoviricetes sp.]
MRIDMLLPFIVLFALGGLYLPALLLLLFWWVGREILPP